ncbi:MAG: MFS transporter, partial [Actinomycetota bacterium]|nr:MFS transporter [Actinomycetota bacterium]
RLFGRVLGAYRTVIWGVMPFGAAAGGLLAKATDLRAPLLAMGLVSWLLAMVGAPLLLHESGRQGQDEVSPAGARPSGGDELVSG